MEFSSKWQSRTQIPSTLWLCHGQRDCGDNLYLPGRREANVVRESFKCLLWKHCLSLLMASHWPEQRSWPHLTSMGLGKGLAVSWKKEEMSLWNRLPVSPTSGNWHCNWSKNIRRGIWKEIFFVYLDPPRLFIHTRLAFGSCSAYPHWLVGL